MLNAHPRETIYIYVTNAAVQFHRARAVCYFTVYLLLFLKHFKNKQAKRFR